jgi:hypothetical protein
MVIQGGGTVVRGRIATSVWLAIALVLLTVLGSRLGAPLPIALAAPALEGTPDEQLSVAADKIAAATARDGSGFTFTVVSRSTLHQRDGGPLIEVPDPVDPKRTLELATSYYVGGSLAEGIVTPDGYFLQLKGGPVPEDRQPDIAAAVPTLAALVKDGKTFRDDGDGWYETDLPPGIGLDEATIALLPTLLRDAGSPEATDARLVDGAVAAGIRAEGSIEDAPALHAVGTLEYTELLGPMSFALDEDNRLVEIGAVMRNLRMETFDLLVTTTVTLRYPTEPLVLPEPVPAMPPETPRPSLPPADPEPDPAVIEQGAEATP